MDEATLIKFHLHKPKISYLFYPDFDRDPHPKMQASMQIDLRDLQVRYRDYHNSDNSPVLHCKDAYILPDYPQYEKFAKLTKQEESWGLLENMRDISLWQGWQQKLKEYCAELQGHRLVWIKDADPETIKCVKAQRKSKKLEEIHSS